MTILQLYLTTIFICFVPILISNIYEFGDTEDSTIPIIVGSALASTIPILNILAAINALFKILNRYMSRH